MTHRPWLNENIVDHGKLAGRSLLWMWNKHQDMYWPCARRYTRDEYNGDVYVESCASYGSAIALALPPSKLYTDIELLLKGINAYRQRV